MPVNKLFRPARPHRPLGPGDFLVLLFVTVLLYAGVRLAFRAPEFVQGPEISLSPTALPWYAFLSTLRMLAAYTLSLAFSLFYGYKAAHSRYAERVLLPLLDVLQSIPILSFLPVAVLGLTAFLPERVGVELASIFLIFTSQAWNMTFAWYQSLITLPGELREASDIFRFNSYLRFRVLELPFAAIQLIWNSMMSWAGGWFFLMAAEMFTVGARDFRLPGLGSYLQEAAHRGNTKALAWGLVTLIILIIALDQFVWRPLLAWAERFKLEMVESEVQASSWFYELLKGSRIWGFLWHRIFGALDQRISVWAKRANAQVRSSGKRRPRWFLYILVAIFMGGIALGAAWAGKFLTSLPGRAWLLIAEGAGATTLRVVMALAISAIWTVPVGLLVGLNPRAASWIQPVVQIAASIPATALFPILVTSLVRLPFGLNLAAVILMLAGSQWYILFNVIAGARAIPQDLKYTALLMKLSRWQRWRILYLPALFPYLITGAITASGGAWNASIVAECVAFGGASMYTTGLGALIAQATEKGDYALLFAATLTMIVLVVAVNRFLWRRLYRLAEERYRLE
ncbi:MAG: ABC transporter permease subunit [Candidatus Bipolaricaulota bacterium]|nr:ABC transporter permease subunit [Candidatus Bipolaricaulota bacterium]MDW8126832.1 ABC transporter permease subunit [Candidatus Bipolaricaulota bacterium]